MRRLIGPPYHAAKRTIRAAFRPRKWRDLEQARQQLAIDPSDAGFLERVREVWVRLPLPPADPWSDAYRQHWLNVYRQIVGTDYELKREAHVFDVESAIKTPFPYCTRNAEVVGGQLIGIGSLIRLMSLPAGASILEMGPGWGNTSLTLAQMGYKVTTLDIEERFCRLIETRARTLGVELKVIRGDFFSARDIGECFDAVLFYESFHHCADHLRLLDELAQIVRPHGQLVLAGETIDEDIPYDWGINPNGEAIWQIINNGWFELAFRESYLLRTLARKGWRTDACRSSVATANVYLSRRG